MGTDRRARTRVWKPEVSISNFPYITKHKKCLTIHPEAFDHISHADKLADKQAEKEASDGEKSFSVP